MTAFLMFLVLGLLTQAVALPFIDRLDRRWLAVWMSLAWIGLFLALVAFDAWFPFSGGGDDEDYFSLAGTELGTLDDAFDLTRFASVEQPGYPWLLSLAASAVGHDLVALKVVNLACFILLSPIWYRIGVELGGRRFGRILAVMLLVLTPLWFYWLFLLKDIVIVLLQSLFLLGVITVSRSFRPGGWLITLVTTIAIIPFRSQLVMVHVALMIGMIALLAIRRGRGPRVLGTAVIALTLVVGVVSYASDRDWMASLGINSEARVIGTRSFVAALQLADQSSSMNRVLFPILYFITETTGFSPGAWTNFEVTRLSGVLAIPWIAVVCPFAMFGFAWMLGREPEPGGAVRRLGLIARLRASRAVSSPWGIVGMFIALYMAVSWVAGDTTRWRLADMPAIATVAVAGWLSMRPARRVQICLVWIGGAMGSLLLFYALRGA